MTTTHSAVLDAADALLGAFGRHDRDAYFGLFAPEATFIFHNLDRVLPNRAAYEAEWDLWEKRDGFRIHGCRSTERLVQIVGDVAVFIHNVQTDLSVAGELSTTCERETIVFRRDADDHWLAIHEHLGLDPRVVSD